MTVSEAELNDVKVFCGIADEDDEDIDRAVEMAMAAAKAYIKGYTGLTVEEIDSHEDLTDAFFVLCNEMYSQRDYTLSSHRQISPTVKTILSMYAVNYL